MTRHRSGARSRIFGGKESSISHPSSPVLLCCISQSTLRDIIKKQPAKKPQPKKNPSPPKKKPKETPNIKKNNYEPKQQTQKNTDLNQKPETIIEEAGLPVGLPC